MNLINLSPQLSFYTLLGLLTLSTLDPGKVSAARGAGEEKIFNFDDQYVQIEAGTFNGTSRSVFGIEVLMTPKPGWKLLAGNSSSIKPLRLKFSAAKCLKLKEATRYSVPDLSGTDDSGSYSEYFTKTATIKQEFSRLKCGQINGLESSATLSYLLCQDNKCMGPFSKEIRFKAPAQK